MPSSSDESPELSDEESIRGRRCEGDRWSTEDERPGLSEASDDDVYGDSVDGVPSETGDGIHEASDDDVPSETDDEMPVLTLVDDMESDAAPEDCSDDDSSSSSSSSSEYDVLFVSRYPASQRIKNEHISSKYL